MKTIKRILKIVVVVVVLIAMCAAGFYFGGIYKSRHQEESQYGTITTAIIKEHLEDRSELITQEYICKMVDTYEDSKDDCKIPIVKNIIEETTKDYVVYSYDATISAGIDLSDVVITENEDQTGFIVTLPEAEFFGEATIDHDTIEIYDDEHGIFSGYDLEEANESFKVDQIDVKNNAVKMGILEMANINAVSVMRDLLSFVEFAGYEIEIIGYDENNAEAENENQ